MNQQKNVGGHLIVWSFLISVLLPMGAMSNSLKIELEKSSDNITLQPYELFVRKDLSGAGGIWEVVNSTTKKEQAICNISEGQLDTNEIFIFNEIALFYGKDAQGKVGSVKYNQAAPAELENAEFEIIQGGRKILNIPVRSIHNANTGRNVQDDFTILSSLCYIKDNESFSMQLKFPNGVALPAGENSNFHYGEIRLRGHRTTRKV